MTPCTCRQTLVVAVLSDNWLVQVVSRMRHVASAKTCQVMCRQQQHQKLLPFEVKPLLRDAQQANISGTTESMLLHLGDEVG